MSTSVKTAIVLAGGFGTRLQSVVSDVPKPMAPVAGKAFLEYILDYLKRYDVEEVVLSIGHLAETVMEHFGESFDGLRIRYAHEKEPLGTGGAIAFAFSKTDAQRAFVLNGDTFFNADLNAMKEAHIQAKADVSMVLRQVPTPDRFGTVELDSNSRVSSFKEKQEGLDSGLINGGVYILEREALDRFDLPETFSIEQDYFARYTHELNIHGQVSAAYFIDIGIPAEYARAQEDFLDFHNL